MVRLKMCNKSDSSTHLCGEGRAFFQPESDIDFSNIYLLKCPICRRQTNSTSNGVCPSNSVHKHGVRDVAVEFKDVSNEFKTTNCFQPLQCRLSYQNGLVISGESTGISVVSPRHKLSRLVPAENRVKPSLPSLPDAIERWGGGVRRRLGSSHAV